MNAPVKVLVIDVGGTGIKILASGQTERRRFPSGKGMTPSMMVAGVRELAKDWEYDVVSIGYPGTVRQGRPAIEPHNLAKGWVGFDFQAAFGCPVKMINDAAIQALGSYRGARYSSSASGRVSGPPWSSTAPLCHWNSVISRSRRRRLRTISVYAGSTGWAGRSGRSASRRLRSNSSPPSCSTTSFSAEETPRN